jgi:hypothetical protein
MLRFGFLMMVLPNFILLGNSIKEIERYTLNLTS